MFKYQIHALAMHKLGWGRPFRTLMLLFLSCCLLAGLIYAFVVFQALAKRSEVHHAQHHSNR